jgi:branched-subunit amino acid aminotransferase/4-amino-4-deoxychorismate lyase
MNKSFPILKSETEILKVMKDNIPPFANNFICFFSSHLKSFITDPLFFSIPLEDKMVHRGYAVFETTKIFGNKIYQLDSHIERLNRSLTKVNLKSIYTHEEYRDILMKMASIARNIEPNKDIELRYFYSAGLGNMSLLVKEDYLSFYAVALRTNYSERPVNGVNERLISVSEIQKNVITSKTTNYLINALVNNKSKEQGGYLGIMTDENGNMLETPMSNIAFLLLDGTFLVPPFDKTLTGTTVVRVMDFVKNVLIPEGHIKSIERDYLNSNTFQNQVKEAMLCGGDFVIPILKLNDYIISENPGEITRRIQDFLIKDKVAEEVCEEIPVLV